ncbi:MAG: NADH-quinone oxidoreductase subunit E, partial [Euryarchaeota archaeon]|nr:NADH-quinone oxidoreductase subunit E [Euryarchaeota archaeon]
AFLFSLSLYMHGYYYNDWFYGDSITLGMLVVITLTYLLAVLHSIVCLKDVKKFYLAPHYYWVLLSLFALSMVLAVSSPNIGYAWFWLESSTIISAALILVERRKEHVESAWRYILIASAGLGMALLSVIIFGWATGTFIWVNTTVTRGVELIGVLALLGFGAKAGLFPVHTWLPDAHGTAPSPVSAMLSGALLPSALVVYYRIFTLLHSELLFHLTVIVGLMTLWIAAFLMLSQKRLKRLLAYSSMDVMGIATVGIGISFVAPGVMHYVLILFLAHALGKSSLFLAAGVLKRMGYEELSQIKNLTASPVFALGILMSALTVTGAPPFPMFFGEFGILLSIASYVYAFAALLGGILLSFLALNYHVLKMLFNREDAGVHVDLKHSAVPFAAAIGTVLLTAIIYASMWGWIL